MPRLLKFAPAYFQPSLCRAEQVLPWPADGTIQTTQQAQNRNVWAHEGCPPVVSSNSTTAHGVSPGCEPAYADNNSTRRSDHAHRISSSGISPSGQSRSRLGVPKKRKSTPVHSKTAIRSLSTSSLTVARRSFGIRL